MMMSGVRKIKLLIVKRMLLRGSWQLIVSIFISFLCPNQINPQKSRAMEIYSSRLTTSRLRQISFGQISNPELIQ